MAVDLLIRNGVVYDGTGASPVRCDVLVNGGLVEALTPPDVPAEAAQVIDADGLAVAPGFVDIHTHSDVSVLLDGRAQSKIHQGVTTEVTGNCGFSPFPFTDTHLAEHLDLLAGIGDDPIEPSWTDLTGYAEAVAARGTAVNIAPLVGHGQLRIAALGMAEGVSADGMDAMRTLLVELIESRARSACPPG